MTNSSEKDKPNMRFNLQLCRFRKRIWSISSFVVIISLLGMIISWSNPTIKYPLRPGLDFTGGTQIKLERRCQNACSPIDSKKISESLSLIDFPRQDNLPPPNLNTARVQLLDDAQSVLLRLPFLSANQGKTVIEKMNDLIGPFERDGQEIAIIGPSLGLQLFQSSLISLLTAFVGIILYIGFRYDKRYAFLALIALAHDLIIVCGLFSWLGLIKSVEIDSLFAVALLTIAGYSVNDTVVIFDRIREKCRVNSDLSFNEQIDRAVSSTLTRTIYTSGTTMLPLMALVFFGGSTLYWFAIALLVGVLVGSWSSIALAPSLLSVWNKPTNFSLNKDVDIEEDVDIG